MYQSKNIVKGLLETIIFLSFALMFVACEETSDSTRNKIKGEKDSAVHIFRGTVCEVVGDVLLKSLDGDLNRLSVGQKIFEKNKLVTESRSSVVISVSDGSALKVEGKSEIELDAKIIESLRRKVSMTLRQGRLMFDIQKQAIKDEFEIRNGRFVSVASSTAGFAENVDGMEIFSLKDGRLELIGENGLTSVVTSGQTLLANANGVRVFTLSSSGSLFLARALDSIVTEASSQQGIRASRLSFAKIEKKLLEYDNAYRKKQEEFISKVQPQFKPKTLNEYIGKPSVLLEAFLDSGSVVMVQGLRDTVSESGLYRRSFTWEDSTAFGTKRFIVNCLDDEVEYICHTWSTNFVSAKMAEVLTKADERKALVPKDSAQQPQILKPTVIIEGSGRERIHVLPEERDIPATLRFSVAGLMKSDLKQIKQITIKRKGSVIKTINGNELTTNSFKLPIRLKQNRIAHFEVHVILTNDTHLTATKVFETYCYLDNYENGRKSNRIYDMSAEEEYKNVVSRHLLKNE